jgi:hypothetical protein
MFGFGRSARGGTRPRREYYLPEDNPVLFLEVAHSHASQILDMLRVQGVEVVGHRILRCSRLAISNAIAGRIPGRSAPHHSRERPRS